MTANFKILVGGENLIDFVENADTDGAPQFSANPGGAPYNMAIASARQGCHVDYLTPISQDRLGGLLAERLSESGVKIKAPRVDAPTSLAVVSLAEGQANYQFYRKDTAERQITQSHLDKALDAGAWLFHIGALALVDGADGALWEQFFINCHRQGIITSLDPNIRPILIGARAPYIKRLETMFQYADIIKLSDEDLAWIYPNKDMLAAFEQLIATSNKGLRVLTQGADGAVARSISAKAKTPAHPIQSLADTVGAGDTFMASMLAWLVENQIHERDAIHNLSAKNLKSMLTRANKAAALNCKKHGCHPPFRDEL